jgi:hypothetical protein
MDWGGGGAQRQKGSLVVQKRLQLANIYSVNQSWNSFPAKFTKNGKFKLLTTRKFRHSKLIIITFSDS